MDTSSLVSESCSSAVSAQTQHSMVLPDVAEVYWRFAELSALGTSRFSGERTDFPRSGGNLDEDQVEPSSGESAAERGSQVHTYAEDTPGGRLLLYGALDIAGAAWALAGNIAGLATLGVDADSSRLKAGVRSGTCDFLVNGLDEALRILKNEVRKKQPVSVCLLGEFPAVLREMVERGVQPDLLAEAWAGAEPLVSRGARVLQGGSRGEDGRVDVTWRVASAAALWLPRVDTLAASVLPDGDARLRWLRLAPRYLGRGMAGERYLRMNVVEAEALVELVRMETAAGRIGVEVFVAW